jgi:uncharacterized protein (DUF4415 family)
MMASKKTVSRALVAAMMKRLMIEIEKPALVESPGALPDVEAELRGIDAFVNRMMTAASPASEPHPVAPPAKCTTGTKPVSLRIPNRVINAFRAESMKTGTCYQTLMIRALADAAEEVAP